MFNVFQVSFYGCFLAILNDGESYSSFSWYMQCVYVIPRVKGLLYIHQLSYPLVYLSEFSPCRFFEWRSLVSYLGHPLFWNEYLS